MRTVEASSGYFCQVPLFVLLLNMLMRNRLSNVMHKVKTIIYG